MKIDLENLSSDECNEKSIASVVEYSLSRLGIHRDSEISIRFVYEVEMTDLHLKWMQLDGPTDVLSFPMDEMKPNSVANGPGVVGDIVLCPTYA
ncbi:MAG: rRNA maturation RNase YbeY, partial [bacterium]